MTVQRKLLEASLVQKKEDAHLDLALRLNIMLAYPEAEGEQARSRLVRFALWSFVYPYITMARRVAWVLKKLWVRYRG